MATVVPSARIRYVWNLLRLARLATQFGGCADRGRDLPMFVGVGVDSSRLRNQRCPVLRSARTCRSTSRIAWCLVCSELHLCLRFATRLYPPASSEQPEDSGGGSQKTAEISCLPIFESLWSCGVRGPPYRACVVADALRVQYFNELSVLDRYSCIPG